MWWSFIMGFIWLQDRYYFSTLSTSRNHRLEMQMFISSVRYLMLLEPKCFKEILENWQNRFFKCDRNYFYTFNSWQFKFYTLFKNRNNMNNLSVILELISFVKDIKIFLNTFEMKSGGCLYFSCIVYYIRKINRRFSYQSCTYHKSYQYQFRSPKFHMPY